MASYFAFLLYNTHKCKRRLNNQNLRQTLLQEENWQTGINEVCLQVNSDSLDLPAGGGSALFGRQRVVGGRWSRQLLIKVLNLLLVHLHHHRPLQLHGRACGTSKELILLNTCFLFLNKLSYATYCPSSMCCLV